MILERETVSIIVFDIFKEEEKNVLAKRKFIFKTSF